LRKTNFTKFINSLTDEELREEMDKLFTKYKSIKEYYSMELGSDEDRKKLLDKSKNGIGKLYERFRTRSRLTKVNNILKDISAISIFDHELADVYIHHVEVATDHLNYYGWARDAEYNHLEKSFFKAVDLVTSSQSRDQFEGRLNDVLNKLKNYTNFVDELEIYFDDNLV
jgi:hypothetical protein